MRVRAGAGAVRVGRGRCGGRVGAAAGCAASVGAPQWTHCPTTSDEAPPSGTCEVSRTCPGSK